MILAFILLLVVGIVAYIITLPPEDGDGAGGDGGGDDGGGDDGDGGGVDQNGDVRRACRGLS